MGSRSDTLVESAAIRSIETRHMKKKPKGKRYIACEKYNFLWYEDELKLFREMFNNGLAIDVIAKRLDRHINEIAFIIIDQGDRGYINARG